MGRSSSGPKVFIWVEDTYARSFISRLLRRLGYKGFTVRSAKGRGNMLVKVQKVALDALVIHKYDKLVVLVDGHGDPHGTENALLSKVPGEVRSRVRTVVFDESIEEWICAGLSLPLKGRKPLDVLLAHEKANKGAWVKEADIKRWLPRYAELIDISKLQKNTLFRRLLNALSDCP